MRPVMVSMVLPFVVLPLAAQDSAFQALQQRGQATMGVEQYTSVHHFDRLPDGGRIALERAATDSAGVVTIRGHLQHIARAFAAGDFALPGSVHARTVPGTRVMAARRTAIRYEFHSLPGGGEVRIRTRDTAAISAIREFLAFQRGDHRVADHEGH